MINEKRRLKRYHPGVYVRDALNDLNMSAKEFSIRSGISERTLSDLINEKGGITFDIAIKLAEFFKTSINVWTNLQNAYDAYIIEKRLKREIEDDYELLKPFKKYLVENKVIDQNDDEFMVVAKTRSSFSINRISLLNTNELLVSFKEHSGKEHDNVFAENLWIAYALTKARKIETKPYDRQKLLKSLPNMTSLMGKNPKEFFPILVDILKECGVAFVFVPYLSKSNIYGASKWLSKDVVMLAISNRGGKADVFWFTLFHEIAHVLMEHKRYCLLQFDGNDDVEANIVGSNILIRDEEWSSFINEHRIFDQKSIEEFAKKVNVPSFIVLGRLAKEKHISYSNDLYQKSNPSYRNEDFIAEQI